MIGFDTGFFVKLAKKNNQSLQLWEEIGSGQEEGAISVITLYELRKLSLKKVLQTDYAKMKQALETIMTVVHLTPEIADKSAFISHSAGIHMADAIILSSLLEVGCKKIYTDNIVHLGRYERQGVEIIQIK